MTTVTVEQIQNSIQKGITFVPEVDLRKDLIVGYNYTLEQTLSMSDDEVYAFFDKLEYGEEEKEMYPISCKCGHYEMECTGYDNSAMIPDHYMFECPKCKEVTHIHECAMDNIYEEMDFKNKLNPEMKKIYAIEGTWSHLKTIKKDDMDLESYTNGWTHIQTFEVEEKHSFYKNGNVYMTIEYNYIHKKYSVYIKTV